MNLRRTSSDDKSISLQEHFECHSKVTVIVFILTFVLYNVTFCSRCETKFNGIYMNLK